MICPRCSANIPNGTDTCAYCGATVREAPPPTPQAPPMYQAPPTIVVQNHIQPMPSLMAQEPPRPAAPYMPPPPPPKPRKPFYKAAWFWLLVIFVGIPTLPFLALFYAMAWIIYLYASKRLFTMGAGKRAGAICACVLLAIVGIAGINALTVGNDAAPSVAQATPPGDEDIAAGSIDARDEAAAPSKASTAAPTDTAAKTPAPTAAPTSDASQLASGDLGDYHVAVRGAEIVKDLGGDPAVTITLEWTNNSDASAMFSIALNVKCFQDGVQVDTTVVDGADFDSFKEIKPGATQTVTESFSIDPAKPIELEITELFSFDGDMLTQRFTPRG